MLQAMIDAFRTADGRVKDLINKQQQMDAQLTENSMVKAELDVLQEGEPVYKLQGKVLVLHDAGEAQATVTQRIQMIEGEMCVAMGPAASPSFYVSPPNRNCPPLAAPSLASSSLRGSSKCPSCAVTLAPRSRRKQRQRAGWTNDRPRACSHSHLVLAPVFLSALFIINTLFLNAFNHHYSPPPPLPVRNYTPSVYVLLRYLLRGGRVNVIFGG